ncbi:hypothetical protein BSKO_08858 [Bryopsis sp. KO-2023]|nr:hypothetical protein BSKO_08858 [Bryopsis sp. KO-2023]
MSRGRAERFRDLEVIYRDEFLIVVNKPAGLLVHSSKLDGGEREFALQIVRNMVGKRVYLAHRLDKQTSGLLVMALDKETHAKLNNLFSNRGVSKTYVAMVRGHLLGKGCIDRPLKYQPDDLETNVPKAKLEAPQDATSLYESLGTCVCDFAVGKFDKTGYSLVKVVPLTGRRHQIRRHLRGCGKGHPVIGDGSHGDTKQNRGARENLGLDRMMLHAYRLCFDHPVSGASLCLTAEPDESFLTILEKAGLKWDAIGASGNIVLDVSDASQDL